MILILLFCLDLPFGVHQLSLGEADENLSHPIDATFRDQTYYVLDKKEMSVLVYDRKGSLQNRIGQKGQGPGEFQQPICLSAHNNTILVFDGGRAQIITFDAMGRFIREISVRRGHSGYFEPGTLVIHSAVDHDLFTFHHIENGARFAALGQGMAGRIDPTQVTDQLYFFYFAGEDFRAMNMTGTKGLTAKLAHGKTAQFKKTDLSFDRYASQKQIEHHGPGLMTFHGGQPIKGVVAYGKDTFILIHDERQESVNYIGHLKEWSPIKLYKTSRSYEKMVGSQQKLFLFRTEEGIVEVIDLDLTKP